MTREQIIETMARAMVSAEYERNPNHSTRVSYHRDDAAAALSALEAAGLVLVPVEPTDAMIDAGVSHRLSTTIGGDNRWPEDTAVLYAAMTKAALNPERDSSG